MPSPKRPYIITLLHWLVLIAVTTTGNILELFLSAEGMMLIPVFTVYITRAVLGSPSPSPSSPNSHSSGSSISANL